MNIFGLEIKRALRSKRKNNLLSNFLWPWQYNRSLFADEDYHSMVEEFKSWTYICSMRNATTCAQVPLRLYVAKDKTIGKIRGYDTKKVSKSVDAEIRECSSLSNIEPIRKAIEFEEVLEHPFLTLKKQVNPFTNNFDLMEKSQLFLELTGNDFWYIVEDKFGVPREIWTIPPQNCKIVPHPTKFISGYNYIKGSKTVELTEKDIIHFKFPNPKSHYYGFSPLSAIKDQIMIDGSINDYENALFQNMGRLDGVFETDEDLGDIEFERLKGEISQSFSGTENAGKAPLLSNGVHYKPFGLAPKEMSYINGRGKIKEIISNAYGQSLGMYDRESNRANTEMSYYIYAKDTIQPRLKRKEEKINEKLIPRYDGRLFVKYDNPVPTDKIFDLEQRSKHVLTGIESINEARKGINLEPFGPEYDTPLVPVNMTTIERLIAGDSEDNNVISDIDKIKELLK
ncbi:MAG: phage portal protein [Lutibacter sp.]|uniref:phage portal protein n=1 Tax=Lutibacter sp. TaxID=1925666 RepID=UPI0019E91DDF|nr:phage portal protein [Lutibacter sp.]NOR27581.1 phage portal protein [Lutibacter sp.]